MDNIYKIILDLVFPIQSEWGNFRTYLDLDKSQPEPHFINPTSSIDQIIVLSYYTDSAFSELIPRAKNNLEFAIARDLALFIDKFLRQQKSKFWYQSPWTCVPSDPGRLIKRNFHLPALILKELVKLNSKIQDYPDLLVKTQSTPAQASLDRERRLSNLDSKISINPDIDPKMLLQQPETIILLDDVTTTGATLEASAKILRANFKQAKIISLVIASDAGL